MLLSISGVNIGSICRLYLKSLKLNYVVEKLKDKLIVHQNPGNIDFVHDKKYGLPFS